MRISVLLLAAFLLGMMAIAPGAEAKTPEPGTQPAVAAAAKDEQSDWRACLPEGVKKAQVRAAVQAWLRKYPRYSGVEMSFLLAKVEAWLVKHPEMRNAAVSALIAKGKDWLARHPKYAGVPAADLMAQDLAQGLPCE
jgi:hypothetical protein